MEKVGNVLLQAIVIFLLICGLGYVVDGNVNLVLAIGVPLGFSIAGLLIKKRH
ncbi:hypothetical protein [Methanofollis formosanus]|uniref:hypothetical protein n=1 Tax=Methanofollis formosanus TaxID=299308 RepID=UPI001C7CAB23|nr:hypothetical protein [Methanofollis formosanus]